MGLPWFLSFFEYYGESGGTEKRSQHVIRSLVEVEDVCNSLPLSKGRKTLDFDRNREFDRFWSDLEIEMSETLQSTPA